LHPSRIHAALLLLVSLVCVPLFGAAIAPEVTIPMAGYLELPNELTYRTELTLTNHRDVLQYVEISRVNDRHDQAFRIFAIEPHSTVFLADGGMGTGGNRQSSVGAFRVRAILPLNFDVHVSEPTVPDPLGRIEVTGFVVADRGRFASRGSSRQELEAIPSSEYTAEEAVFLGVRHDLPTYTNVFVSNLHPTQTETFYVQYKHLAPIAVVVPPLSVRQIRIPGEGNAGRSVVVYPEWAIGDGPPARTTPWVAAASTVDGYTGDAYSGMRVPVTSRPDDRDRP
jgi:hypothetical protein